MIIADTEMQTIYLATDGKDSWSGSLAKPADDGTDGPLATVAAALEKIFQIKKANGGSLSAPVQVLLRDGIYFQEKTVTIRPEHSGSFLCPVSIAAYPGEKPVLSGGSKISGWKPAILNGKNIWAADVPDVKSGNWYFKELWVNGERRFRARTPKTGMMRIEEVPDLDPKAPYTVGQQRFRFFENDIQNWENLADVEVILCHMWVDVKLPIQSVDEKERLVTFTRKTRRRMLEGFDWSVPAPYYVENAAELLSQPGEWYLNRQQGCLYYFPKPGEKINEVNVIAPKLEQILRVEGRPELGATGRFVEHIRFKGLTFSHSAYQIPLDSEDGGDWQAAIDVPSAIYAEGLRHCQFLECDICHVGSYGIELARACQNNQLENCAVFDTGAGGIRIGETIRRKRPIQQTYGNVINNCHVYEGGQRFHQGIGIWIGQSFSNRISNCHIHDFYYSGISIGWTWGYTESIARDNVVEFNHVHHIGFKQDGTGPYLSDMGGIYTLGAQPGTVIRNNVFHDIKAVNYGGWGIYFDEGSTDILAENNLVYRVKHSGFHQHYGKENIVRNNIFAFGTVAQIQRTKHENHISFIFERNIVLWESGDLLAGNWDGDVVQDRNLYWNVNGCESLRFGELTFAEWQAKGFDVHSKVADPGFSDARNGNFKLKPDSPAFSLGFQEFELPE